MKKILSILLISLVGLLDAQSVLTLPLSTTNMVNTTAVTATIQTNTAAENVKTVADYVKSKQKYIENFVDVNAQGLPFGWKKPFGAMPTKPNLSRSTMASIQSSFSLSNFLLSFNLSTHGYTSFADGRSLSGIAKKRAHHSLSSIITVSV